MGKSLKKRYQKKARKYVGVATGGLFGGEKEKSSGDAGMRSEAAKRLVNRNQQAGSGSINFNTEEYVE